MTTGTYPTRINHLFIYLNNCAGKPLATGDGSPVFWFPGKEAMELEAGPTFRTISEVSTECFSRAARNETAGSDAVFRRGCGFSTPEFDSVFLRGYTREYTATGGILKAVESPAGSDCWTCGTTDDCDKTFTIIADICEVDCEDKPVNRRFDIVRRISQATLSNRSKRGGNNPGNFSGDITLQTSSNSGWGAGPANLFPAYDADGNFGTSPVVEGIPKPATLNMTSLDEAGCGCKNAYAGKAITADLVAANPLLNHPLITGVAA